MTSPGSERLLTWVGFPLAGAAIIGLLTTQAGRIASLDWAPWQGPFWLLSRVPVAVGALVGGLAGLALGYVAARERLTVAVSGDRVTFTRAGETEQARTWDVDGEISAAFVDGKRLVLLGPVAEELAREKSDLAASRLRDAFQAHGYHWLDSGDPYEYQRWVDGEPALSAKANAILRTRERSLDKGEREDVARLRTELAELGIVVRDEHKRQFWRRDESSRAG